MLCYVWNRLDERGTAHVSQTDEKDIYNLLARILLNRLKLLVKRGFYKEYVSEQENTPTIRGRINFPESLNKLTFQQATMYCEFDELSYDILHNQIIKTTLDHLLSHPHVDQKIQEDIQMIYPYFRDIQRIRLTARTFHHMSVHRTNQHYGFLMDICKFLFDALLMHKDEESNDTFTDFNQQTREMAYLFEDFVRNFYARELLHGKVYREHIFWDASGDDLSYLPKMETDISIEMNQKKIIMDTKFYKDTLSRNHNSRKIISDNMYQIFAYISNCKRTFAEKPTGILLYPKVDQDLDLAYDLSGYPLKICTVDMSQPWQHIHERLLEIVEM